VEKVSIVKLAIHQPEFSPWLGFFYKMIKADLYVVFDHVQFKKRYYENRNRIVSPRGEVAYIGVPVITKNKFFQSIKDVEIDNTQRWKDKLLKKVQHFYNKSLYFSDYYNDFSALISEKEYNYLIELNMELINFFRKHFHISTPIAFSSKMNVNEYKGSDLILQICLLNKASTYLCGVSGKDYLKVEDFKMSGINIEWLDYKSPVYKQLCQNFTPNMSTLDLLFNHGKKGYEILMNKG